MIRTSGVSSRTKDSIFLMSVTALSRPFPRIQKSASRMRWIRQEIRLQSSSASASKRRLEACIALISSARPILMFTLLGLTSKVLRSGVVATSSIEEKSNLLLAAGGLTWMRVMQPLTSSDGAILLAFLAKSESEWISSPVCRSVKAAMRNW